MRIQRMALGIDIVRIGVLDALRDPGMSRLDGGQAALGGAGVGSRLYRHGTGIGRDRRWGRGGIATRRCGRHGRRSRLADGR